MSTQAIQIIDGASSQLVDAILHDDLSVDVIERTEASWGPKRRQATEDAHQRGDRRPEHSHWKWDRPEKLSKLQFLAYRCLGVECDGEFQGLMMVDTTSHFATLSPDDNKPLIYIEYIECAPWNVRPLTNSPRYKSVGQVLVAAAIQLSREEGFNGRIGLYAIPQAVAFYEKLSMQKLGVHPIHDRLTYFEFSAKQAASLGKSI